MYMEPTIHEDDLLLIDIAVNEAQGDRVYGVKNGFSLQIKCIQPMIKVGTRCQKGAL